jgi:hypothetical protein
MKRSALILMTAGVFRRRHLFSRSRCWCFAR